jgi:hypothetical protein
MHWVEFWLSVYPALQAEHVEVELQFAQFDILQLKEQALLLRICPTTQEEHLVAELQSPQKGIEQL